METVKMALEINVDNLKKDFILFLFSLWFNGQKTEVPDETENQQADNTRKSSSVPPCTPTPEGVENAPNCGESEGQDLQQPEEEGGDDDSKSVLMEILSQIAAEPEADYMQDIWQLQLRDLRDACLECIRWPETKQEPCSCMRSASFTDKFWPACLKKSIFQKYSCFGNILFLWLLTGNLNVTLLDSCIPTNPQLTVFVLCPTLNYFFNPTVSFWNHLSLARKFSVGIHLKSWACKMSNSSTKCFSKKNLGMHRTPSWLKPWGERKIPKSCNAGYGNVR